MSGKGTAVDAAVGVGEGDAVGEGDVFCACAPNAKHSNSRLTTIRHAPRTESRGSVISQWLGTQSSL
ncbi:MAG: hypothetical protein Udaeo2_33720 [Candidatus Udaeobacter sp.]|nr:MAG: hypothetical protein Udaeo2_33720 [Candidatus Udaeobacter sp.]